MAMEQASEAPRLPKATDLSSRCVSKCEAAEYFCQQTTWIFLKETYSDRNCGDRSRYVKHDRHNSTFTEKATVLMLLRKTNRMAVSSNITMARRKTHFCSFTHCPDDFWLKF